jgi:trk system potassium uptake protein TrkH
MKAVLYNFAYALAALAALMCCSGMTAAFLLEQQDGVAILLIASGLWAYVAGLILIAFRGTDRRLRARERFILAVMLFTVLPLLGAVPIKMMLEGITMADAYFEAVSAMTTTGWTALPAEERLPVALLLWRSVLQWLGGLITLLAFVFILAPARVGGLPDSFAGRIEHRPTVEGDRVLLAVRDVAPIYTVASLVCMVLLLAQQADLIDAITFTSAALATGGFTSRSADLSGFPLGILWTVTLFSLVGAMSIIWQRQVVRGRRNMFQHRESVFLIATILIIGVFLGAFLTVAAGGRAWLNMSEGFAIVASVVTTSGLEIRTGGQEAMPYALLLGLVLVGGASFSTAGGVKLFRIGAMLTQSLREMTRLVYPHAIRPARFGTQTYNIQIMKAVWSMLFATMSVVLAGALIFSLAGLPADQAILGGAAAASNFAASLSVDAIGTPLTLANQPDPVKLVLAALMIAGRLEILAVLAVMRPSTLVR